MQYLMVLAHDPAAWDDPQAAQPADWAAYTLALHEAAILVGGAGLQDSGTATTVRVRDGQRLLTDGPFADGDAETTGLLALMLLQHSRAAAREDGEGRPVPFAEQDRSRWDAAAVAEARALLATTGRSPVGPYQVQAVIAALHAAAPDAAGVDWARIADLYRLLDRLAPSPVVTVNRAVAVGRAEGPEAGLALLAPVLADGRLAGYVPLHAAHADLLERAGDAAGAAAAWRRAAELSGNPAERAVLDRRAAAGPAAAVAVRPPRPR
ncbi:hypothetical protein SAMN06893096_11159 [Geodermatophilus pulveris]|uniref:DUF6596 domain-containing protein n=1 Tax=Geodermatophilus pulveris TaxID=1564159 RepID=A0A239IM39_9ACTN|nr:DUF6596 domain-containing protein [Geodermatophilus pulveris]SNS94619.1 hypothetical protein SAMN06893096_11159 [Geodermatophilus pulveris]